MSSLSEIFQRFDRSYRPTQLESLGQCGGLSGARFWRLTTPQGIFCLRRWPREHPNFNRLQHIHRVLLHVAEQGFELSPTPVCDTEGNTIIQHQGHYWELAPWRTGNPLVAEKINSRRVETALQALAKFHRAASSMTDTTLTPTTLGETFSAGIRTRSKRFADLHPTASIGSQLRTASLHDDRWSRFAERYWALFDKNAQQLAVVLSHAATLSPPRQACIRDIWRENLLFVEDDLTGIVDFGALDIATPAGDVARLLGSLAVSHQQHDQPLWNVGLEAYLAINPLSADELTLVKAFDFANMMLSPASWFSWVVLERRQFPLEVVERRLNEILGRLESVR